MHSMGTNVYVIEEIQKLLLNGSKNFQKPSSIRKRGYTFNGWHPLDIWQQQSLTPLQKVGNNRVVSVTV